ncbi:MAG: hypothetical protein ACOCV2_07060 [Persicimonas sp.]
MSDPKEILNRRLDRVAEDGKTRGLHFFCQIGGHDDPLGLTTLQIAGSGWTLLSWKRGDEQELFSVELGEEDLVEFYAILREHPFWAASPSRRKREEGETNIHLRFADQGAGTYGALQFWEGDIDDYPVLRGLLAPLINLIRLISNDEIPHLSIQRKAS